MLARAAGSVVAIDPHAGSDRGPQEIEADAGRGEADHDAFNANLEAAGVAERVRHVRRMSDEALGDVDGPLSLLFVDGAHRFAPARDDIARWGGRVAPGGTMLVHDAFSSIGVTGALLAECAFSPRWRYRGRAGSLADYERVTAPLERRRPPARRGAAAARAAVVRPQRGDQGTRAGSAAAAGGAAGAAGGRALAVLSQRASAKPSSTTAATVTQWTAMRSTG